MAAEAGLSTVAGAVSGVDPSSTAMRVRLEEPDDLGDIIVFLRSCDCRARHVSNDMIDVGFVAETEIQRSLDLVAAGRCYGCAAVVTEALAELGSPLCQDCRDSGRGERPRPAADRGLPAHLERAPPGSAGVDPRRVGRALRLSRSARVRCEELSPLGRAGRNRDGDPHEGEPVRPTELLPPEAAVQGLVDDEPELRESRRLVRKNDRRRGSP